MTAAARERRTEDRTPLAMPVLCTWRGAKRHTGEAINLSSGGMLMEIHPRPHVGTRILLAFGIGALGREFVVPGEVVRTEGDRGVGVRYLWPSTTRRGVLHDLLTAR